MTYGIADFSLKKIINKVDWKTPVVFVALFKCKNRSKDHRPYHYLSAPVQF